MYHDILSTFDSSHKFCAYSSKWIKECIISGRKLIMTGGSQRNVCSFLIGSAMPINIVLQLSAISIFDTLHRKSERFVIQKSGNRDESIILIGLLQRHEYWWQRMKKIYKKYAQMIKNFWRQLELREMTQQNSLKWGLFQRPVWIYILDSNTCLPTNFNIENEM